MVAPAILVIDNVDSFTFMLVDYLRTAGADVAVVRNDELTVGEALERGRDGLLISPGPGAPEQAGISIALASACIAARRPLLGVCLGHQALAIACGGTVGRVPPMHGKTATIVHDGGGIFAGLPSPMLATRYHSLAVTDAPAPLVCDAWSEDGTLMAMHHADAPAHGVQFHPESVASTTGPALLKSFVRLCGETA